MASVLTMACPLGPKFASPVIYSPVHDETHLSYGPLFGMGEVCLGPKAKYPQ